MESKDRPILLLGIAALCILTTSLLPIFFKTLFVAETGPYTPLPPALATALVILFIFRKDWARKITLVICSILSVSMLVIILVNSINNEGNTGIVYLLLLQLITIFILKDWQVKSYLEQDNKNISA